MGLLRYATARVRDFRNCLWPINSLRLINCTPPVSREQEGLPVTLLKGAVCVIESLRTSAPHLAQGWRVADPRTLGPGLISTTACLSGMDHSVWLLIAVCGCVVVVCRWSSLYVVVICCRRLFEIEVFVLLLPKLALSDEMSDSKLFPQKTQCCSEFTLLLLK